MPMQLVEDAYGDPRNAAALAAACQFAYYPADQGAQSFQDELGLTAKFISVDNTQAYIATNDEHVVIAFRGSQDPTSIDGLKDWLMTNAFNLLIVPEGELSTDFLAAGVGAKYHQGFVSAITEIWPELFPALDAELKQKDRVFWVTGHSLGGALAILAAWLFKRKFLNVHQVYTFGAPMIGNKIVADSFNREFANQVFRFVNSPDPVPLLPMMSFISSDYSHCDKIIPLGDAAASANLLDYLQGAAGGVVDGVLSGDIQEKVWGGIKSKISAHFLNDYRGLIVPG